MLKTKLQIPQQCKNYVSQSGLFEKFNEGIRCKLILISAPAGFGKSTAVSSWLKNTKQQVAWYSIDKRDNDPAEFLAYIVRSIQTIYKDFGLNIIKLLQSPQRPGLGSVTNLLIDNLQHIEEEIFIVFDDFHNINSDEVFDILKLLLEYLPGNIHLILSTRSDPTIPMARLRSQNELLEIRASDLSFKRDEITHLFNKKLKLELSLENIKTLESKTEGWIAGLQLTSLSLQGKENVADFLNNFAGNNRYIMDYLIEEVLNNSKPEVKEFLLKTSILEQISGPLCDALLNRNDSQIIIELLEKENMFIIPLDSERQWYRYHHLFADLLKLRLQFEFKPVIPELHTRACSWFEDNNMLAIAIEHALEIKDYKKSISLLSKSVVEMWENGHHASILRFGELLPDKAIENNAEFSLYYSWTLISAGKFKEAGQFLNAAENAFNEEYDLDKPNTIPVDKKNLLGKISVAFAYLLSNTYENERMYKYCEQAKKYLSKEDPLWYSWMWFSFGVANVMKGRLQESNKAFNEALIHGRKSGNLYLISTTVMRLAFGELRLGHYKYAHEKCHELLKMIEEGGYFEMAKNEWAYAGLFSLLGHIYFIWNDLDKACEYSNTGYELAKKGNDIVQVLFNSMVYVRIHFYCGNTIKALEVLNEIEGLEKNKNIAPFLLSTIAAFKIGIYIEQKDFIKAEQIVTMQQLGVDKEIILQNELVYISYARLLLAQLKIEEAEKILNKLHHFSEPKERIERVVEIKNLLGMLHLAQYNNEAACKYVTESLILSEPENLIWFYMIEGKPMAGLLMNIYKESIHAKSEVPGKFIKDILNEFDKNEQKKKNLAEDILSSREVDTLNLMSHNLSNQEIAEKLFISLNTVKTHTKNIYLKLEVNSRTKAVDKAKKMGII